MKLDKICIKRTLFAILLTILSCLGSSAWAQAQQANTYFPYPVVPEEKSTLTERCNYLVFHFWDRCNLKQSFSSLGKLQGAIGDWVGFMPYATTDTVHLAIDNFIGDVAKIGAKDLVTVAKMAESIVYSDSSEIYSEELYLPFCKAVSENKKANKESRAYFGKQVKIIESTGLGRNIPAFDYVALDGSTQNFGDVIASRIMLLLGNPDDFETSLAKARLSADYNLSKLVEQGLVKVVFLYPGQMTDQVKTQLATFPETWIVGALPDYDTMFDIKNKPEIFYLDPRRKILGKNVDVDNLLLGVRQINQQMQN